MDRPDRVCVVFPLRVKREEHTNEHSHDILRGLSACVDSSNGTSGLN